MKNETLFVRWHSRAGQGAVTAANFFAEALGTAFDYKVQSFPDYGAEKRGAHVVVYNRASKTAEVLDDPAHLKHLDLVILLDSTLIGEELSYDETLEGLTEKGQIIINTAKQTPSKFNSMFEGQITHLNATKIALETVGRNVPNVAMIGGLTKILDLDPIKMEKVLLAHLSEFFNEKIVQKNMEGFHRGMLETLTIKSN